MYAKILTWLSDQNSDKGCGISSVYINYDSFSTTVNTTMRFKVRFAKLWTPLMHCVLAYTSVRPMNKKCFGCPIHLLCLFLCSTVSSTSSSSSPPPVPPGYRYLLTFSTASSQQRQQSWCAPER